MISGSVDGGAKDEELGVAGMHVRLKLKFLSWEILSAPAEKLLCAKCLDSYATVLTVFV